MKNRMRNGLIALSMISIAALAFSSCSFFLALLGIGADISGTVVDAQSGIGLNLMNASVTLINTSNGDIYSPSVDYQGNWYVNSISKGNYQLQVSENGYFFTSFTGPVTFAGAPITAPTIAGLYTPALYQPSSGASFISFILTWNNNQQLDLDFTGPDGSTVAALNTGTGTGGASIDFTDPSYDPSYTTNTLFLNAWNAGFGPNGSISVTPPTTGQISTVGRLYINPSTTSTPGATSTTGMVLNTKSTSYGPDTITLHNYIPVPTNGSFAVSPNSYNSLPTSGYWQGVGIFYIDSPVGGTYISTGGTNAAAATSTYATLWAVEANADGSPNVLGVYTVPTNTTVQTMAALRLNIFDFGYQLVPLMQTVQWGDIRSVATTSGVVTVSRPSAK